MSGVFTQEPSSSSFMFTTVNTKVVVKKFCFSVQSAEINIDRIGPYKHFYSF